jgi:hypothetical protein
VHEYVGAIHIHSEYSDGSGKIADIARYANEVGLDFIMLTDHNTLKSRRDGCEGWYDNVMVMIGYEINDKNNRNHYLAFNLDRTVGVRMTAQEYVKRVKENGGIGFIAHPDEKRRHLREHPPYPWTAWDSEDFDGIEIWNHMSEWMEGLTEQNKYQRFVHPLRSIDAPPKITLKRWDDLNQRRRVVGIGSLDAHAHRQNLLGFFDVEIFHYKVLLKSIHTHVILPDEIVGHSKKDFEKDKQKIYQALAAGRCFVANSYHGNPKGFRFYGEYDKVTIQMGEYVSIPKENHRVVLRALIPQDATIRLLRNGKLYDQVTHHQSLWEVSSKGAYRIEVCLDGRAWIFSNHIRIGVGSGI